MRLDLGCEDGWLGLGLGRERLPQGPLTLLPPFQPCPSPSPSKAHQGYSGVGGPGEHEEKDDQQLDLGHFPLVLQTLPLPGALTTTLAGPESLESSRKHAESGSEPTRVAVSARVMAAVREPSWTRPSLPVQAALTPRKFPNISSLSCLPALLPVVSSLSPTPPDQG